MLINCNKEKKNILTYIDVMQWQCIVVRIACLVILHTMAIHLKKHVLKKIKQNYPFKTVSTVFVHGLLCVQYNAAAWISWTRCPFQCCAAMVEFGLSGKRRYNACEKRTMPANDASASMFRIVYIHLRLVWYCCSLRRDNILYFYCSYVSHVLCIW